VSDVVYLHGREHTLPPLITTIDLLTAPKRPVVSARCASLVRRFDREQHCGGLLSYQGGRWLHANACWDCRDAAAPCPGNLGHVTCDSPEPLTCLHGHGACPEPADIDMQCVNGGQGECCGCCWTLADMRDGRRLWPL
jgi:hypothetical protein